MEIYKKIRVSRDIHKTN